uniref:Uncharacterized protein n=1 Tax=Lutzomyia longipalpis TaxID=7200 RepID=A0A1B0CD80_LUTLO
MSTTLRSNIIAALNKVEAYVNALTDVDLTFLNQQSLKTQLDLVETLAGQYVVVQDKIIGATRENDRQLEIQDKDAFLQGCQSLTKKIKQMMTTLPPAPTNATDLSELVRALIQQNKELMAAFKPTASTNVSLPHINLPTFSGKYSEWLSFKDRFKSSVINHPTLSAVQKLEYLKSSLTEDAASTIKHLPTTETNFRVAWALLVDRFERKNEIVAEHIRSFYAMTPATSSDPSSIQRICNIFSESVFALDAMQISGRDPWLVQYTLDKLDSESRVLWGRECGKGAPTLERFKTFLNQRCVDAANASALPSDVPNAPRQQSSKPIIATQAQR